MLSVREDDGPARAGAPATKQSLSPARRQLLESMQRLNFGRIERLPVRGGEPVLDPKPRIIRDIKLGAENGARPEAVARDFSLKAQVIELFQHFDQFKEGTVETLEVRHGLPFRLVVEMSA